jgi:RNA polymerase sigma factor (sigma-70 family)
MRSNASSRGHFEEEGQQYLLQSLVDGNAEAIDHIYENYFPVIDHYICRNSGSNQDTQDVFQDGLMALYYKVKEKNLILNCTVRTYLFAICRNLWLKELRRRKVGLEELNEEILSIDDTDVEESCKRMDRYRLYQKHFKRLGDTCQKLLRYYMQGVDMKSIAKKMKLNSENNARKRKFECKQKLMELIQKDSEYINTLSVE